jgi:pyruvate dehydrogenase E1 component beta subunit
VCVFGEDVGAGMAGLTLGLQARFGPDRVVDLPLSEQAFTSLALGAALAGRRPVVEFQIPSLLFLVFEQIANQAHKISLMTGGQAAAPVTYVVPGSGSREGWAGQHSDHPYSLFAHVGVKTLVPATPADAYGLLTSAIRDPDPVVVFAPAGGRAPGRHLGPRTGTARRGPGAPAGRGRDRRRRRAPGAHRARGRRGARG